MDFSNGGYVCIHLLTGELDDPLVQFTGVGTAYNFICEQCGKNFDELPQTLRETSKERFEDFDGYYDGIIGQPEVFERSSRFAFTHENVQLREPLSGTILSIQPENDADTSKWIAILSTGELVRIDLTLATWMRLAEIPPSVHQISQNNSLHLSPDNRLVAIVNDRESLGLVLNLLSGQITMSLNRGNYHAKQTLFPVAFFQSDDDVLLVHATAWNKLDISDPNTGTILTEREFVAASEKSFPDHYLDYFHNRPIVSPNSTWIAEDGWVWSPVGMTRLWNLKRWLTTNIWESEDGESVKRLTQRAYHWNAPLCWISRNTLAVWGFGNDDLHMVPAVQLFDAETGKRVRWFAGPKKGALYFDSHLFSTSKEGTDVWDIETGERLLVDSDLIPTNYHPGSHQFLTVMPDGAFRLTRLNPL
jgi:hypothetical protein